MSTLTSVQCMSITAWINRLSRFFKWLQTQDYELYMKYKSDYKKSQIVLLISLLIGFVVFGVGFSSLLDNDKLDNKDWVYGRMYGNEVNIGGELYDATPWASSLGDYADGDRFIVYLEPGSGHNIYTIMTEEESEQLSKMQTIKFCIYFFGCFIIAMSGFVISRNLIGKDMWKCLEFFITLKPDETIDDFDPTMSVRAIRRRHKMKW